MREALIFQTKCYMELGRADEANELLTEARQRFPDDPGFDVEDARELCDTHIP